MDLSNISRRKWVFIVICLVGILALIVFLIAYFGLDYPTVASNFWVSYPTKYIDSLARVKIALVVTVIVVGGGIGSFYSILYLLQRKEANGIESETDVKDDE